MSHDPPGVVELWHILIYANIRNDKKNLGYYDPGDILTITFQNNLDHLLFEPNSKLKLLPSQDP